MCEGRGGPGAVEEPNGSCQGRREGEEKERRRMKGRREGGKEGRRGSGAERKQLRDSHTAAAPSSVILSFRPSFVRSSPTSSFNKGRKKKKEELNVKLPIRKPGGRKEGRMAWEILSRVPITYTRSLSLIFI